MYAKIAAEISRMGRMGFAFLAFGAAFRLAVS
jgi:hypothetical protein